MSLKPVTKKFDIIFKKLRRMSEWIKYIPYEIEFMLDFLQGLNSEMRDKIVIHLKCFKWMGKKIITTQCFNIIKTH